MDTFICKRCGFAAFKSAPEYCPVCHAPKTDFELNNNAIKKPADARNLNELEKKHIPVITIQKQCGLVGPGCIDSHIKIGAILHPMEAKHFIGYIDLYLDYNFISRVHFAPDKINPVLGVHLKASSGKLTALSSCNLHGRWTGETEL